MKKNNLIKGIISTFAITTLVVTTVFASTAGSSDDPIVTKSYVDDKVAALTALISGTSNNNNNNNTSSVLTEAQTKAIVDDISAKVLEQTTGPQSYVPVQLNNGQTLLGGEGTEIILRSGSAVASISGTDGLVNATNGSDLLNKVNVPKNNILIVPRNDGRGVQATSNSTWLIVKGSYTIN